MRGQRVIVRVAGLMLTSPKASRAHSRIVYRPCRKRGAGSQLRVSAEHERGGARVRKYRVYDGTPGFESRCVIFRFRIESSQTRKRTYTLAPTKRTLMIAIVGRWLVAVGFGAGCGAGAGVVFTTAVLPEDAVVVPARFFAVTTTRSVLPTSAPRTPYVLPVAPLTSEQLAPASLQRCHWYENERTPPAHVPWLAVSSSPGSSFPVTAGAAVFLGGVFAEMTSVVFELADVCPSEFEAVTITRTVWSTSAEASRYVFDAALSMFEQSDPSTEHRCQR